ncbi:unnamed protein product [Rotaria magnacalcarata]|uniref:Tetraspanin n=2 Tax=Rotaria magnacalcarata TaxID=392030 RepID=A0A816RHM5_9BILA|nr:unnamed protein product [Rotaria magnacalcarata]CAF2062644.1 unnamed protein product [Rotaria magnacalcarata]CAF2071389.1 unnamed protein product [Rotaria magnacalcarata]CAF2264603.1 unnamed protein product [Rotaria magnacalcarata]CAF3841790.1 unnamed protein product [Rotaria magnacalcarata]
MYRGYSLISTILSGITIIFGSALIVAGSICMSDTYFLRHGWQQIYALSICSVIVGVLTFVFAGGLLYVVSRKLPALTIVISISILVVSVFAVICLIILGVGIGDLKRHTYNETEGILNKYSTSGGVVGSQEIIGKIQESFGCCSVKQVKNRDIELSNTLITKDSCCFTLVSDFKKTSILTVEQIQFNGFSQLIFYYVRKRYLALITLNTIVTILLLATAIFGFIFEHDIRQQYVPM